MNDTAANNGISIFVFKVFSIIFVKMTVEKFSHKRSHRFIDG